MAGTITVIAARNDGRVACWDRDPKHPPSEGYPKGGELYVVGDGKTHEAWPSPGVMAKINEGALRLTDRKEAEKLAEEGAVKKEDTVAEGVRSSVPLRDANGGFELQTPVTAAPGRPTVVAVKPPERAAAKEDADKPVTAEEKAEANEKDLDDKQAAAAKAEADKKAGDKK